MTRTQLTYNLRLAQQAYDNLAAKFEPIVERLKQAEEMMQLSKENAALRGDISTNQDFSLEDYS